MFFATAVRASTMLVHWLLILRFDGSVRHSSDRGSSSDSSVSRAACAAALLDDDEGLLMVGGKRLGLNMNSMDAEYEGLLFGLEELIPQYSTHDGRGVSPRISIQGDCRTVLQHVDGRAKPRLLQDYCQRARSLVSAFPCRVELEYIPRDSNTLCDAVAGAMVREAEHEAHAEAWASLTEIGTRFRQSGSASGDDLTKFWRQHSPNIHYSRRTIFYRRMAATAALGSDFETLVWVGRTMGTDIAAVQKPRRRVDVSFRDELFVEALAMQLFGLSAAGVSRQKEADSLRHKHRYILRSLSRKLNDAWALLERPEEWLSMENKWNTDTSLDENRTLLECETADNIFRESIRRSVVEACRSDSFASHGSFWIDAETFKTYGLKAIA